MRNIRKLVCLLAASTLAFFAPMSFAESKQKIYSLEMTQVQTVPPTFAPPFTLVATLRNLSPNGNSSINSFLLSTRGLRIDSVDRPESGDATVSDDGQSVSVTKMRPLKPGEAFQLTLRVTSCGDGTWSADAWSGSNLKGSTFTPIGDSAPVTPVACGILACQDQVHVTSTIQNDPTLVVTGQRGTYDKDGATCDSVPYYVTNTISLDKKLHFRWPTSGSGSDSAAAFFYTVTGTTPPQAGFPKVSWLNDTSGNPVFVTAPPCLSPNLPAPYGTLGNAITATQNSFAINLASTLPTMVPFDIVIGSERIQVNSVTVGTGSSRTLNVTRAVGGTTADSHLAIAPVMSTPLPILTTTSGPYTAGKQAQMCLAGQSGNTSTVIDIGDGWVNVNP